MALDRTDIELLRLLRKNARLPNKTLAEMVGVAPSTALERVRRLREAGVLQGFHAEVLPAAIGISLQAMVAVRLTRHSRVSIDSFVAHMATRPEILAHYHVAGADDFLVHVVARDADHLRELTLSTFTEREEVAHIETHLIFAFQRNTDRPVDLSPESD